MKIFIGENFGCALNYQYNLIGLQLAKKYEITKEISEADALVFASTCSCTEGTINACLNYIYSCITKKKPKAKVYLTGCLTRTFKFSEQNAWMQGFFEKYIDFVVPQNKPNLLLQLVSEDFSSLDPEDFGYGAIDKGNAMLFISNGCNNNCAFCKVSYQDYPIKSVEISEVKECIDKIAESKCKTISLIGTNICVYGLDLYNEPRLLEILDYIEKKSEIEKVKLVGFAYKNAIRYKYASALALNKKVDYISGSLETGSPRLLEMIRKGFTPEEFVDFISLISSVYERNLDLNIISGLPTETLDDVKETLRVLYEVKPYCVNISEYINSSMLSLSRYPQLSDEEFREHTSIYEEELKRRRIKTNVVNKK